MQDKVVIITGASSGIGKALVYNLASKGAKISMAARNTKKLEEIKNDIEKKFSTQITYIKCDVTKELDCKNLINTTIKDFRKIDVLINNAGISMRAIFDDVKLSVIRDLMNVNFWGTVYCTKFALPYLQKSKGSLVGIISIAGYIGLPGRTAYSASKFAVRGFLDTIRIENLKKGLHVLVAAPGFTASNVRLSALVADGKQQGETPRDESNMMSAEKCAEIISKGIIKRKRKIIMTFEEGKLTVFLSKWMPKILDKLIYNHMAKEPNSPFK